MKSVKRTAVTLVVLVSVAIALVVFLHLEGSPPSERVLIANFHAHQGVYEQLKLMLQKDDQVSVLAPWGVVTAGSIVPEPGNFPLGRFNAYLSLLREAHALGAFRSQKPPIELCVLVWASGWAADTRHVAVCWLDRAPLNPVASIDDLKWNATPGREFFFRQVEGNWYLREDW